MATTAPMQRETIRLAAAILVAVLALRWRLLRLRCTAGDKGREPTVVHRLRLRLWLRLAIALLIIVVALNEWLRILRKIRLLACSEWLSEGLGVFFAFVELLIGAWLELLIIAALGTRLEVRILLTELLLRGSDQAEIMFGVLKIIFRRDRIAGRLGITRKLEIFLRHMIGGSANLHIRAVRFINPRQGILIAPVVMLLIIIAPTHTLVMMLMLLTVSHGLLFNDS
jgi:hypothetical protein